MSEAAPAIQLFNQTEADLPLNKEDITSLVELVAVEESCHLSLLEVVYVDEEEIVRINREHLQRDYITDIITFRYDEDNTNKKIEGTLFCCAPRIYEQASELNEDTGQEFKRILVHGLLHLCGYDDSSPKEKKQMTDRENFYLEKLTKLNDSSHK